MKQIYVIFILIFLSCGSRDTSEVMLKEEPASETNFDWLLGNWKRVNEEGDKMTYESWEKSDASAYHGFGYTLLRSDTVWQENILLVETGDGWNFEVTGKGESKPTIFKLTDRTIDSFVSQNPEHDFPTEIRYFKSLESLRAVISGEGMEISFEFERIQ